MNDIYQMLYINRCTLPELCMNNYIYNLTKYSFYYGSLMGIFKHLSISEKKLNLKKLKFTEILITQYNSLLNGLYYIFKYGITYSLISLTFPISVPLIIYLYNEDDKKISDK